MSTCKVNTIENVAGNSIFRPEVTWDGLVLDENTTPKLSEVSIIGTNPEAKIYPDGSIVGSSSNGNFTKHANGNLEAYGAYTVSATTNANVLTYPIPLVGYVQSPRGEMYNSSSIAFHIIKFNNIGTANSKLGLIYKGTGDNTHQYVTGEISYSISGRWK